MSKDIKIVAVSESWMYLSNRKGFSYELIENLIMFCNYYIPFAMLLEYFNGPIPVYRGLFLFFLVILMIIVKRKIKNFFIFIFCNIGIIVIAYIMSISIFEKVIFTSLVIIYSIFSIRKRYETIENFFSITAIYFSGVFLTVFYIAAFNLNMNFMKIFISIDAIIILLSCTIYIHLTKTDKLLEWETKYAGRFISRVRKMKLSITCSIITVITVINLFFWKSGIFNLMESLQRNINKSLVFQDKSNNPLPTPSNPPVNAPDANGDMLNNLGGPVKNNIFLMIIVKIIEFVIIIFVIIICIYILWLFYLKLKDVYRRFYEKGDLSIEKREIILPTEDITTIMREKAISIKYDLTMLFHHSNKKKIRSIYYKIVTKQIKRGIEVQLSNTPFEIKRKIEEKNKQSMEDATNLYEKARYSNEECSSEEVHKMKSY